MEKRDNCRVCNPPQACLVACPNNAILDRMSRPVCIPLLDVLDDQDAQLEIGFAPDLEDETA